MAYDIGPKIGIEGEVEFRKAINNINDNLKTLGTEMKTVTSQYDRNDKSTENLTAQNKVLNKQIEQQKKVLSELHKGLSASTDRLGENDTCTQKWQRTVNNATSKLNKMERRLQSNTETINKNEKATDDLGDEVDDLGKDLKETENKALSFGDVLKANLASEAIVGGVKMLASGIKNVASGVVNLSKEATGYADEMITLSAQTGIATDKLQEFNYMQELTDVSVDTITKTMAKQTKSMKAAQDGTKLSVEAYEKLGISVMDANGNLRDGETVYWEVIDTLGEMQNETERDAIAMQLVGKSAQDLNPLIKAGSKQIKQFAKEAREAGAVLDEKTLNSLLETDDAMQRITQATDIAKRKFGAEMAPYVMKAADRITDKITDMDDGFAKFAGGALEVATDGLMWIMDNSKYIISGIGGISAGMAAFKIGGKIVSGFEYCNKLWTQYKIGTEAATVATQAATAAQTGLNTAQKASPWGLVAAGVGVVVSGIILLATKTKDATSETDKQIESFKKISKEAKELNEKIEENRKSREKEIESIEVKCGATQKLSDELYDLADKENKTNAEKAIMKSLVDDINEAMPELNLSIDEETGKLNKNRTELEKVIEANLKYYKVKAAEKSLTKISEDIVEQEIKLNELEESKTELTSERATLLEKISDAEEEILNDTTKFLEHDADVSYRTVEQIDESINEASNSIEECEDNLNKSNKEWNKAKKYIRENADVLDIYGKKANDTNKATEDLTKKTKHSTDALREWTDTNKNRISESLQLEEKRHNDAITKIREEYGVFEEKEKSKTDILQEEYNTRTTTINGILSLSKNAAVQEREAFKKSSNDILEQARELHNEKIAMYSEEYLMRIGAINDNLLETVDAYQKEINSIKAKTEKENAAIKAKSDAEKIAELEQKKREAKTDKERISAQEALQDEIHRQERERLLEQRDDRIAYLNDQINIAKAKAVEEKNALYKTFQERINNEQLLIKENTDYNIKKIQEERKAKEKAEIAKYNAAKNTLDKTKEQYDKFFDDYKGVLDGGTKAFSNAFKGVTSGFDQSLYESGMNAMQGFIDGINSKSNDVKRNIKELMTGVVKQGNVTLEIKSPSRAFRRMGVFSAMGYDEGFEEQIERVKIKMARSLMPPKPQRMSVSSGGNYTADMHSPVSGGKNRAPIIDYGEMTKSFIGALRYLNLVVVADREKIGKIAVDEVAKELLT